MSIALHGMFYGGIVGPCSQTRVSICDVVTYRIDKVQGSYARTHECITQGLLVYVEKDSDQYLDS